MAELFEPRVMITLTVKIATLTKLDDLTQNRGALLDRLVEKEWALWSMGAVDAERLPGPEGAQIVPIVYVQERKE